MEKQRRSIGEKLGLNDEIIKQACTHAMEAHNSPPLTPVSVSNPSHVFFAFPGTWCLDWYSRRSFGESKIDLNDFPSLRSIGNDETASVNMFFLWQFQSIIRASNLLEQVRKATSENKQIVFSGHSSGGPVAVLATAWLLEQFRKLNNHSDMEIPIFCVTFGSLLIGDRIFGHALEREGWSSHFIHFFMRCDIIPRILLAPLSAVERELPVVLQFLNPKSAHYRRECIGKSQEVSVLFSQVMRNTLSVASHAACLLMGSTNLLLEAVTSFVELSPYRPFGTCVFCNGSGKLIEVKNPDAVLQLLFYSIQLSPEHEVSEVSSRTLEDHLAYELKLQQSLQAQDVIYLDNLSELSLSTDCAARGEIRLMDIALNDFGLSTQARICLRATGELENQKLRNQEMVDANSSKIEEALKMIQQYQATCELREIGYYDAFKFQREAEDFRVNVKRLELAGMWDEIVEMLKRYELPAGYEARKEWIDQGTRYRRLVEPLDIANYYRHSKNDDTGPYMTQGRPKRYRYTQRWLEHASNMAAGSCSESCFWAEVEELRNCADSRRSFEEIKERVMKLEMDVLRWAAQSQIARDVFLEGSTFVQWWRTLPQQHKAASCLSRFVDAEGRNLPRLNYTR